MLTYLALHKVVEKHTSEEVSNSLLFCCKFIQNLHTKIIKREHGLTKLLQKWKGEQFCLTGV